MARSVRTPVRHRCRFHRSVAGLATPPGSLWDACYLERQIGLASSPDFACTNDLPDTCPCDLVELITISFGVNPFEVGRHDSSSVAIDDGFIEFAEREGCRPSLGERDYTVEILAATDECVTGSVNRGELGTVGFMFAR